MSQHGDFGVGLDVADQGVAATRDDQVNHVIQLQQVCGTDTKRSSSSKQQWQLTISHPAVQQ
jgi:hypothetical protein